MKEEIIIRFFDGECTPTELGSIREWLKNPLFKKEFSKILESRWEQKIHEISDEQDAGIFPVELQEMLQKDFPRVDVGALKKETLNKLGKKRKIFFDLSYYLKIAAVFLIFIFSFFITIYLFHSEGPATTTVAEVKIIKKEALIGQKLKIHLTDGSKIILNSGSSLEYPEKFGYEAREVKLAGEAFFEIMPDASRPFKVVSSSATTTVLGTTFNINEREEGTARITLKEGKVRVDLAGSAGHAEGHKNVFLSPGEMAIVNPVEGGLTVEQVDVHEQTAWQKGIILFKNKPLQEIFSQLEMWYDVGFEVEEKIEGSSKVSGEFANENLENILSGLSFSFGFKYSIAGNEVKIYK